MTKERKQLNRFVTRTALACAPLFALIAVYFILDPFNVIGQFNPMDKMGEKSAPFSRSHQSVEAYVANRDSVGYNAFIFGSSRAIYYPVATWRRYLPGDARCVHMDAAWETLEGMLDKLELIQNRGDRIKYAILEFHPDQFADSAHIEVPYRQDYRLRHSYSLPEYHYRYFMSMLNTDFLKAYLPFLFAGRINEGYDNVVFESKMQGYDPISNEYDYRNFDREIDTDSLDYFTRHAKFYQSAIADSVVPNISADRFAVLKLIQQRLRADNTDYHIVLGPTFYRRVNNPADIRRLRELFGAERVHDFQHLGVESQANFYDSIHYRYFIADSIMSMIYDK